MTRTGTIRGIRGITVIRGTILRDISTRTTITAVTGTVRGITITGMLTTATTITTARSIRPGQTRQRNYDPTPGSAQQRAEIRA